MDLTTLAIQVSIVMGINEAIKKSLLTKPQYKYIPLLAIALGLVLAIGLFPAETVQQSVTNGLIVGLSSVGLFSTAKNVVERPDETQ